MPEDQRLKNIEILVTKIFVILNGKDDEGGLVTKVALHEQKFQDIPSPNSLRFHASVGGGIVTFFSLMLIAIWHFFGGK
ncbi:hypothetical protein KAX02_02745 [candidate division WOR-3 bacterium]|nr:hypothetical protein [candidate division WOR-3 bacterium]